MSDIVTVEGLRQELLDMERAYDWAKAERDALVTALERVADDEDGRYRFSYAPGVSDSLLVELGHRKHWDDRER